MTCYYYEDGLHCSYGIKCCRTKNMCLAGCVGYHLNFQTKVCTTVGWLFYMAKWSAASGQELTCQNNEDVDPKVIKAVNTERVTTWEVGPTWICNPNAHYNIGTWLISRTTSAVYTWVAVILSSHLGSPSSYTALMMGIFIERPQTAGQTSKRSCSIILMRWRS